MKEEHPVQTSTRKKFRFEIPTVIKTYGLFGVLIIASFWFAAQFIGAPSPTSLTIAAGSKNGAYYQYAEKYRDYLATQRITATLLETAGSIENIDLLKAGKADIAFVQSGLAKDNNREEIQSLASLYYEPLWIFTTEDDSRRKDLQQLAGTTIAIGKKGSGTNALARELITLNGMDKNVTLQETDGLNAVKALEQGRIDALFMIAPPSDDLVTRLINNPDIRLISFERAAGYSQKLPFLSQIKLNEGVLNMELNQPEQNITLIAPVAQLVTRTDFNGSLKYLLASATMHIHENETSLLSTKGTFPTLRYTDFPIADQAQRFFKDGLPALQRFLPFWLADMVNRMIVMLIPLLGVMIPLLKIAPPTYRWRTRAKIYRWYKDLKKLENSPTKTKKSRKEILDELDAIDKEVMETNVPLSYADELYNLRLHIYTLKSRIAPQ
jgi:TRAP transporter TAXI family solute receptor